MKFFSGIKILLIVVLCAFLCFYISAQKADIISVKKHLYTDGIKTGKLHEFKNVFEQDQELSKKFNKFNRLRKAQKGINFSCIGITGISAILAPSLIQDSDGGNQAAGQFFSYLGVVSIGPAIMIITNPILGGIKKKRKKQLLTETDSSIGYNGGMLSLVLDTNKIGLVYSF